MDFPDLVTPIYQLKERSYRVQPCHSNRASTLGGDCERALVYDRTRWEEAARPGLDLITIFQEGEKHEQALLDDLRKSGVRVEQQQVALEWREFQITGHVDAVVVVDDPVVRPIPLEIKSMSPHIFDATFKRGRGVYPWEEVKEAFQEKPWLRRYLGQLTIYMLCKNVDRGILLCLNKGTGAVAQVDIELDYTYGESLLQRATRINGHVAAGTLPDRLPFDEEVCPRCPYFAICLPEIASSGRPPIAFIEQTEVVDMLSKREQLEEAASEYDRVDKRFKTWAKALEQDEIGVGRWVVRRKQQKNGVRVDVQTISGSPA